MNILLLGSGGREHAFAWKLSQSGNPGKLYIAPGNAGTALCGENVQLNPLDFETVLAFCRDKNIALILPGNEDPLVAGIVDFMTPYGIAVAGPDQYAATLASWFGVTDADLPAVAPNVVNFSSRNLGFLV